MIWLIRFAARRPWWVLIILVAITGSFGTQLDQLRLHASFDKMMLEGDKARVAFDEFREVFGERETVLLFLSDEQLLRADNLAVIERTLKLIQAHSFVNTTSSLFSLKDVRVVEDGEVLSRPYLDSTNPPVGAKAMDSWLKHALSDPVLADQFISRDGKGMVVAIELTTDLKGATRDAEIVSALIAL